MLSTLADRFDTVYLSKTAKVAHYSQVPGCGCFVPRVWARIPILIVFADHHADAPEPFGSRWTTSMAQCRAFAESIRQAGGDVTFLHLPEIGIHGNTHMFMLDRNNLQIADLLLKWIDQHVEHAAR